MQIHNLRRCSGKSSQCPICQVSTGAFILDSFERRCSVARESDGRSEALNTYIPFILLLLHISDDVVVYEALNMYIYIYISIYK